VFEPTAFLEEICRVTKPGGHLLLTVPFVWDEHEQPYDFARYSSFGLRHLLSAAGFRIIAAEKTLADPSVLVQLWLGYLYKLAVKWPKPLRVATFVALAVPSNLLGLMLQKVAPASPDFYLDNVVFCQRNPE
jgi:SAM-dependent methyltransferase